MAVITKKLIKQSHLVTDATVFDNYDRIRWLRSRGGKNGPFEACTASAPQAAELVFEPLTAALAGKLLSLELDNGDQIDITFAGPNPISASDIADEVALAGGTDIGCTEENGVVTIYRGGGGGTQYSLKVLDTSDVAPLLGLAVGQEAIGKAVDSTLVSGTSEYYLSDYQSGSSFWYCVEYYNSDTDVSSERTVPIQSRAYAGVPADDLIGCYVRLASLDGNPLPERTVTISNVAIPNTRTNEDVGLTWSIFRNAIEGITDVNGYVEFRLVKGAKVDVNVGGTGFTRRVTLPSSGAPVNLLDPNLDHEDEFGIQEQDVEFAIRTT
jgi:hypothetical protein